MSNSTPKINAVTFDLWETLIADSSSLDSKRTLLRVAETGRVLARYGVTVKKEDLSRAHRQVWEKCLKKWEKAVDLPFEKQVGLFLELAEKGLDKKIPRQARKRISTIYAEAVLRYPPRLVRGAQETLLALKKDGYRLGLICNTGRTPGFVLRKLLSKYRLLKYFDSALFSDETIVRKPDPRIFRQALKELGASPGQAVHVGDDPNTDIAGALRAGMEALWVETKRFERSSSVQSIKNLRDLQKRLLKIKRPLP